MNYHKFDVVIVGSGGAGLMSAMQLAHNSSIAVISKLYPTRSHTGAAQGGVAAALGNDEEDHWQWHMFDTVKGGDYLVDQDAAAVLTQEAIEAVYDLEHWGLPFNRTPDGKIDQRRFGGHTRNYGEGPVRRSCYAADRTGHMILQTMFQQSVKNQVNFFNEYMMLDLLINNGQAVGVVAMNLRDGELHVFHAKTLVLATGGYGRAWRVTSNALACTGDGMAVAYRRGIPLEDMEMFQFHPTGLYKVGILLSEAARGEGAYLLNKDGERFCIRYAPTLQELAPRDMVSRFITQEIAEGRGIDGKDYVYLSVAHLGKEKIDEKLPDITDFARNYLGVEPYYEPVPIQPTAHYAMGGIPTNIEGQVVIDANNTVMPGLYAAGEVACVSVHGANRLGTNSLVDLIVFGRRAGKHIAQKWLPEGQFGELPSDPEGRAREQVEGLLVAHQGRDAGRHPPGNARRDDGQGGRRARRRGPARRDGEDRRAEGALRNRAPDGSLEDLQHGADGSDRARKSARLLRGDCRGRAGAQREPWRALSPRLREARRRELPESYAGLPVGACGRAGAEVQAGRHHGVPAERAQVLVGQTRWLI